MDHIRSYFQSHEIRQTIGHTITRLETDIDEEFLGAPHALFSCIGIDAVYVAAENLASTSYYEVSSDMEYLTYRDDDEVDYSILEAVGLIRRVETGFFDVGGWAVSAIYYHPTELGYHFSLACGVVQSEEESATGANSECSDQAPT